MSDADLDTQGLCDRLNALTLSPGLVDLTCDETIRLWWEDWEVAAHVNGTRRTSYVLVRDNVWVWLTIRCGTRDRSVTSSANWSDMDTHARAMILFGALYDSLVSDYTGIYLGVQAWAQSEAQTLPLLKSTDIEGSYSAGSAHDFLAQLGTHNGDADRTVLSFMSALRERQSGPVMPCTPDAPGWQPPRGLGRQRLS